MAESLTPVVTAGFSKHLYEKDTKFTNGDASPTVGWPEESIGAQENGVGEFSVTLPPGGW